ncbi:hypothetical protein CJ030_MR6G016505 [Morella rubra]|uniref:Uncharacterized protein n=1 Tax=Morella rubra TaxID=262757 RepID=A0A6A1V951_9ROSI|nr:hypothetical protein CJ030_MR6G016505 [Morella rubra]
MRVKEKRYRPITSPETGKIQCHQTSKRISQKQPHVHYPPNSSLTSEDTSAENKTNS